MWLLFILLVVFVAVIVVFAFASDSAGGKDDLPFD